MAGIESTGGSLSARNFPVLMKTPLS